MFKFWNDVRDFTFLTLDTTQIERYRSAMQSAFPDIILNSKIIKYYWKKLERYFPGTQLFMVDENDGLIGSWFGTG